VPVSPKVDFPALDCAVQSLWDERRIFARSIAERPRDGKGDFVAYDGPPGTNGIPHIGHMMQSALKDLWPRFKTMQGYRVRRKAGWDTHGLPIELTAEKELGLGSKRDIETMPGGVAAYIDYCRSTVYRYKDEWVKAIRRIGRFLDTYDDYATLRPEYIETDWWAVKTAWDKGLLYQDRRIMPYCSRCGTSLSQHEVAQGYKDVQDISLYVKFRLTAESTKSLYGDDRPTHFVAWTTTPWTLLSNVALAVNSNLNYVRLERNTGDTIIIAEDRLDALMGFLEATGYLETINGNRLSGLRYKPLWSWQSDEKAHKVIADDYVTADDGSGIVHLALYGEDDFRLIRNFGLPLVQNVDADGKCTPNTGPFAGRWFREEGLDVDILKDLASRGLLFGKEKITHSYPHCYRCDTPLMYFARSGWFLKTSALRDNMLAANETINWYPEHIKKGRFGNWLENNVDWNISRDRYWGSPLPIWECSSCGRTECLGSFSELEARLGHPLPDGFDAHKPYIDTLVLKCLSCGSDMRRVPEVLDCWFNAGIMPWGQWGYPAASGSAEMLAQQFPADFICEAIDQTRGWFYTMLATSVMLTARSRSDGSLEGGESSFRNVICSEFITDPEGRKMSKSRGNVIDPIALCDRFGADAVRWNFYSLNPWTARRHNDSDVVEVLKQVLIPWWNAYSFFVTYARVDGWTPSKGKRGMGKGESLSNPLDRWILSQLTGLRDDVTEHLERYDVTGAVEAFDRFIDDLTNWHIRRSRRRFWKSDDDADKAQAYATLYRVLTVTNRLMAPFIPFTSEAIYQNLERGFDASAPDSVHLTDWPAAMPDLRDAALESAMAKVRRIVSLARSLRADGGVRVRQPLPEMIVAGEDLSDIEPFKDVILDELNVKTMLCREVADGLYTWKAKADYKVFGPRFGANASTLARSVGELTHEELSEMVRSGSIRVGGESILRSEVLLTEVPLESYWVRIDGGITVALCHRIDDNLTDEWLAREFVHHIQSLRRDAGMEVEGRIVVEYAVDDGLGRAITRFADYVRTETLARDLIDDPSIGPDEGVKIGERNARVRIRPVS